jgi:hypothetical protein
MLAPKKLPQRIRVMFPPWGSLDGLQNYHDGLTKILIAIGVIIGVLTLAAGLLGYLDYRVNKNIELLKPDAESKNAGLLTPGNGQTPPLPPRITEEQRNGFLIFLELV